MGKRVKGERERQRQREIHRKRETQRERETERETEKERHRERHRESYLEDGGGGDYRIFSVGEKVKINTSLGTLECRFPHADR